VAGGVAFASVENIPVGDGVYWAITTMTTAGYGDINAGTPEGKVITITVMLVGIGFAALVIGAIAERFTNRHAHAVELTDEDLVKHVQEISTRLQILERVLLQRQPGDSPPTHARPAPERSA
jgi:voltage-gated potassium channel